jgi:hypothetical protein
MKLSRFIILAFAITVFSLLYVWQQTEVFRLAYDGQKSTRCFQDLLDENSVLRYNLKRSTSLVKIGNKLSGSGDFQMPNNYCLVKLINPNDSVRVANRRSPRRENLVARIFGVNRQAEAKTINTSSIFRVDGN